MPDHARYYINDTGTGNTLNMSHACILQMVTDSLRYWSNEMGVDGFRFDLATILGREPHGFDEGGLQRRKDMLMDGGLSDTFYAFRAHSGYGHARR